MKGEALVIVGKNSYVGGCLSEYAASRGMDVISVSSKDCNFLEQQEVVRFFSSVGQRPCIVVFLAVINKRYGRCYAAYRDNVKIVRNFIEGHKHANIRSIVYFSTVDVYGTSPILPIVEESRINPDGWYALAKHSCEWMLLSSGEVRCPVTALRFPGIYGPFPREESTIGDMISTIRRKKRLILHGNGTTLRDYVFLPDVCRLLERLVPLRCSGVFNVASGKGLSLLEIGRMMKDVLDVDFEIVHEYESDRRNFDLVFDVRKLMSVVPDFRFTEMPVGLRTYLPSFVETAGGMGSGFTGGGIR